MNAPDILLDTNVVSFLSRPCREGKDYARHLVARTPAVALITMAELRFGALKGGWGEARWQKLEGLVAGWAVIPGNDAIASHAAGIMNAQRRAGSRIEWADAWIAATAIALDLPLLTHDRDFFEVDGLEVITVLPGLVVRCPEPKREGVVDVTAEEAMHWAQLYVAALESGKPHVVTRAWGRWSQRDSSRATAR